MMEALIFMPRLKCSARLCKVQRSLTKVYKPRTFAVGRHRYERLANLRDQSPITRNRRVPNAGWASMSRADDLPNASQEGTHLKTRLSLLLMIVLSIAMLGSTQQSTSFAFTTVAWSYGTGAPPQTYPEIYSATIADPRNLFRDSSATDKSFLWKVHLALQLVKHPKLNPRQVRIVLDLISLSSPEFFATNTPAEKAKADEAIELLKRRALRAFPNSDAAKLFASISDSKTEAEILKQYYDISALPIKSRKAAFRSVSPNDKSNLWRTHLALFLVKRGDLSEWQRQVILSAISIATPDYFAVRSSDPAWETKVREPSRQLEQQIASAFVLEDAAKIFATLGDDAVVAKSGASVLLKNINYNTLNDSRFYKRWTTTRLSEQDMMLEQSCSCSTGSDYCPIWSSCNGGGCSSTESGCGTLWSNPCNGACK